MRGAASAAMDNAIKSLRCMDPPKRESTTGPSGRVDPGALLAVGFLEGGDLGLERDRQAQLVEAFQQHLLAARRDVEANLAVDQLLFKIDLERCSVLGLCHQV